MSKKKVDIKFHVISYFRDGSIQDCYLTKLAAKEYYSMLVYLYANSCSTQLEKVEFCDSIYHVISQFQINRSKFVKKWLLK